MDFKAIGKLRTLFRPDLAFQPTNSIEIMMANRVFETDPRSFFSQLCSRNLHVIVASDNPANGLKVITTEAGGHSFAQVFTSENAINFVQMKSGLKPQHAALLNGRIILETMAQSGLGIKLNAGLNDLVVLTADNVRYVLHQLNNPDEIKVEHRNTPVGTDVHLGIPASMPILKLNALAAYLSRNTRIEKFIFGLQTTGLNTPNQKPTMSFWIGYLNQATQPGHPDDAIEVGRLWVDVVENDPNFLDLPVDVQEITIENVNQLSTILITVTKEGWVDPQG